MILSIIRVTCELAWNGGSIGFSENSLLKDSYNRHYGLVSYFVHAPRRCKQDAPAGKSFFLTFDLVSDY